MLKSTSTRICGTFQVLRVSNSGPDELMKYISFCGQGGAGAQTDGCADIVPL